MKILNYVFYFILVISVVYFTFYLNTLKKNTDALNVEKSKIDSELIQIKYQIKDFKQLDSLEIKNCFKTLQNVSLKGENSDDFLLKKKFNADYELIYRYFEVNCQSCIIDVLKNLSKSLKNKSKLKIIASYQSHRELLVFKRINQIQIEIYNIENQKLINELDLLEIPYLLLVDKDLKIISVHILSKEFKNRNRRYVDYITNFLNK